MITGIEVEYQSDAESTKDLAQTSEIWGVVCEYLWEIDPIMIALQCTNTYR